MKARLGTPQSGESGYGAGSSRINPDPRYTGESGPDPIKRRTFARIQAGFPGFRGASPKSCPDCRIPRIPRIPRSQSPFLGGLGSGIRGRDVGIRQNC